MNDNRDTRRPRLPLEAPDTASHEMVELLPEAIAKVIMAQDAANQAAAPIMGTNLIYQGILSLVQDQSALTVNNILATYATALFGPLGLHAAKQSAREEMWEKGVEKMQAVQKERDTGVATIGLARVVAVAAIRVVKAVLGLGGIDNSEMDRTGEEE